MTRRDRKNQQTATSNSILIENPKVISKILLFATKQVRFPIVIAADLCLSWRTEIVDNQQLGQQLWKNIIFAAENEKRNNKHEQLQQLFVRACCGGDPKDPCVHFAGQGTLRPVRWLVSQLVPILCYPFKLFGDEETKQQKIF
jgi:hypothetical protein